MMSSSKNPTMSRPKFPPLFSKPLPTPPSKKSQILEPDNSLDPARQRINNMMVEAVELANKALKLEKESNWEEALTGYSEVCSFFKKMMENADSNDLQELLFVHHKYSRRLVFIRTKVSEMKKKENKETKALNSTTLSKKKLNQVTPINTNISYEYNRNDYDTTQSGVSLSPIKTGNSARSLSDSKITPITSIMKHNANMNNNSYSMNTSLNSAFNVYETSPVNYFSKNNNMRKTIIKKSSLPSITENYHKLNSNITSTNNTNLYTWNETNQYLNSQRKSYDVNIERNTTALDNVNELRRNIDLISIPETEENSSMTNNLITKEKEIKGSAGRLLKQRLAHMPSLPELSKTKTKTNTSIIAKSLDNNNYYLNNNCQDNDNDNDNDSWRESCTLPTNFDINKEMEMIKSNHKNYIFATAKPRLNGNRKPSVDKYIEKMESLSLLSPSSPSSPSIKKKFIFNSNSSQQSATSSLNNLSHLNNSSSSLNSGNYDNRIFSYNFNFILFI
ncbi:hypothetical protein K502DRAFT_181941 [Neoconidiobolus thromboides FSU 785]|nr:hypothetical protein K502DRAFT_181941 [Neoconidiobolus thromboides FSU 785]